MIEYEDDRYQLHDFLQSREDRPEVTKKLFRGKISRAIIYIYTGLVFPLRCGHGHQFRDVAESGGPNRPVDIKGDSKPVLLDRKRERGHG